MHVTLLGSALPLWMQLLQPGSDRLLTHILLGFATFLQMGLLGALLTLSPALLYGAHVTTTLAWGHAPLADQQLGGLIMWIPGCSSLLMAVLWGIWRSLSTPAVATTP
jgi:putative membrane protein